MTYKNNQGYTFKVAISRVTKNHQEWTFRVMAQKFGSKIINDKPKFQRPDVDGSLLMYGEGNQWQRELMKDIIKGNPFQPIHLRLNRKNVWEIVDGGHRTRAVYKFLNGFIRLPKDTIITDVDGNDFDISNMTIVDILTTYPFLGDYIDNLKFEVYEYRNITNKEAEELFLKLNDLHTMSDADKRNAIDNIIADVCRDRGAVDSQTAINIFKHTVQKGNTGDKRLQYVPISINKRATDEMISFALYYLYSGGVFAHKFGGMEKQPLLNVMYRDEMLIKRLLDPKDTLVSDLDNLLKIINNVVMCGRLSDKRSGTWGKGAIKKLIMLITESARNAGGFNKYKPDVKELFSKLKVAYGNLSKSKVAHHPYQLYNIIDGVVTPLTRDKQPSGVRYHELHQFTSVFTGGARVDDLLYTLHQFITEGVMSFGLKTTKKDTTRTFSTKQNEQMWVEQGGKCKKTGVDLLTCDYAADHILPHTYGGPTDIKNGQLLSSTANQMKSSGMDIDDVKYLCEKYDYSDFDGLSKYILKGTITLSESQIKEVKQIIIK